MLSASLAKPFDGGIFSFSCQDQLSNDTQGKGDSLDTTDCLESNLGLMWAKETPWKMGCLPRRGRDRNKTTGGLLTPICRLPLSKRWENLIIEEFSQTVRVAYHTVAGPGSAVQLPRTGWSLFLSDWGAAGGWWIKGGVIMGFLKRYRNCIPILDLGKIN